MSSAFHSTAAYPVTLGERIDELDIIGIGAVNVDYIITAERASAGDAATFGGGSVPEVQWGTEAAVDESVVDAAMAWASVEARDVAATPGGSAYNALFSLAKMKLNLRLGYVGVSGRSPVRGLSGRAELAELGVDVTGTVPSAEVLAGVCLSVMAGGERTLLTYGGANDLMAAYIDDNFEALVIHLLRARIIHVTSFLDGRTPERLARLLAEVRRRDPAKIVCLDPGHVWSVERPAGVADLLALSDFLLVNSREFAELAGAGVDTDRARADSLLAQLKPGAVVLQKRPAGVSCYRRDEGGVRVDFYGHEPLADHEVRDATGAGDVFAAGLLAVLQDSMLKVELGALLGMTLARHKLRFVGGRGHADFADLTSQFIRARDMERTGTLRPPGIFIAHGRDPQWLVVRDLVIQQFDAPVYSFESGVWGSSQITGVLDDYLNKCGLAICVLTAEDIVDDGHGFARQNVVHEVGLFQGRYGAGQVVLLVEEGCQFIPDISENVPLSFSEKRISEVLWPLTEQLRANGVPELPRTVPER